RALGLVVAGCGYGTHPSQYAQFQEQSRALAKSMLEEGMVKAAATYGHGPGRLQLKEKDSRGFAEFERNFSEHSARGSANTLLGCQARPPSLYNLTGGMARISAPVLTVAGARAEPAPGPRLPMQPAIASAALAGRRGA